MERRLIIAGGGIGGTAAALALHRAGFEVTLYERAAAFTEVGAGMSLWPNATRVLDALGVLDQLLSVGEPFTRFNLLKPDGRMISTVDMGGYATPSLCLHRADLHRCLRDRLPAGSLEVGQRLVFFVQDEKGVTAKFASGLEVRADGLIAADGINSVVRAQLHGTVPPIYRGYCIWRGIAPQGCEIVRAHISETWGAGQRFGILPMGGGRTCWYATRNGPPSKPDAPEGRKEEVHQLFKDWHHPIPALIEATEQAMIMKNDAQDRPPLRSWGDGRVTLLGDAAHPITPNVGQGACMAVEDAACVAKSLLAASHVDAGFRAYEALRKPRTAFVGRQSRRIGAIGQWESGWIVAGRNLVTRLVLSHAAQMRFNAVYSYKG
jgi:2-polyprenyl-6-methoxyphenol hydroxylase-like FAD-dependent oxidoreductase